jgi:hypothetical protein
MRSRRRPKQTVKPAARVRRRATKVNQNATDDCNQYLSIGRLNMRQVKLTRGSVGARIDTIELADLVLNVCVQSDIDRECDEREQRREEREERGNQLDGQVGAQRSEERQESKASS